MREPGRWSLSPAYDINPVPEVERVHLTKPPSPKISKKRPLQARWPPRRALVSRPTSRRKFSAKFSRLFPAGAKSGDNSASKHPPSTPTPARLNSRLWMKPDNCSVNSVPRGKTFCLEWDAQLKPRLNYFAETKHEAMFT
jgi:hypothetical protein